MRRLYGCGICSFSSTDPGEAEKCEAHGARNRFAVGDKIQFSPNYTRLSERETGPRPVGIVRDVHFDRKTHRPTYEIKTENHYYARVHERWLRLPLAAVANK